MTEETDPSQSQTPAVESSTGEPERPVDQSAQNERPRSDRRGQPNDDRRRKRGPSQERKSPSGYGDGIERAICMLFSHIGPARFPVQSRQGLATSRPTEVARRPDSVLLCDRNHEGDCVWPDGSFAHANDPEPPQVARSSSINGSIGTQESILKQVDNLRIPPTSQTLEVDAAEQPTGGEPETSGGDEERNGSGVTDQDRRDDG
jgi:hypothetical protein